jgi:hypothetical protein
MEMEPARLEGLVQSRSKLADIPLAQEHYV